MSYKVVRYDQPMGAGDIRRSGVVASFDNEVESEEYVKHLNGKGTQVYATYGGVYKFWFKVEHFSEEVGGERSQQSRAVRRRLTLSQRRDLIVQAGKCSVCGEHDWRILEVHHIRPFAQGGSNKPWNLSVLCPKCHRKAQKGLLITPALVPKPVRQAGKRQNQETLRVERTRLPKSKGEAENLQLSGSFISSDTTARLYLKNVGGEVVTINRYVVEMALSKTLVARLIGPGQSAAITIVANSGEKFQNGEHCLIRVWSQKGTEFTFYPRLWAE